MTEFDHSVNPGARQPRAHQLEGLFPNCAFVNTNYLGLSKRKRFDAKQSFIT